MEYESRPGKHTGWWRAWKTDQPRSMERRKELEEIFGEVGMHARAAIGVADLPLGAPVELELIVEVQS